LAGPTRWACSATVDATLELIAYAVGARRRRDGTCGAAAAAIDRRLVAIDDAIVARVHRRAGDRGLR
jgi:hypothetical protein